MMIFQKVFEEFGIPDIIKTDNGNPFGSNSLFGMSRLSVWFLRLGIKVERIQPGRPQENGRHERMHRTLKAEAIKPLSTNFLEQQEIFDNFRNVYNNERPHQGIQNKCPSDLYRKSQKPFKLILPNLEYQNVDSVKFIGIGGTIKVNGKSIFISRAFYGQHVGLRYVDDKVSEVLFMDKVLGYIDDESNKFAVNENSIL